MIVTHAFTPAPRTADDETPTAAPVIPDDAAGDFLHAADAVADAHSEAETRCTGGSTCRRAGTVSVMTHADTVLLCELHALAAVFATPELVALVKPDGV